MLILIIFIIVIAILVFKSFVNDIAFLIEKYTEEDVEEKEDK